MTGRISITSSLSSSSSPGTKVPFLITKCDSLGRPNSTSNACTRRRPSISISRRGLRKMTFTNNQRFRRRAFGSKAETETVCPGRKTSVETICGDRADIFRTSFRPQTNTPTINHARRPPRRPSLTLRDRRYDISAMTMLQTRRISTTVERRFPLRRPMR